MISQDFKRLIILCIIIILTLNSDSVFSQWKIEYSNQEMYTEDGKRLPPRGILLQKYYAGELKVMSGREPGQIVISAKVFSASSGDSRAIKRDETGYLFCLFFYSDPTSYELSDKVREDLFISNQNQSFYQIDGSKNIEIDVPNDASYAMFVLSQKKAASQSFLDYSGNVAYWSDNLLLKKYGVAPFMGKYAQWSISRPERLDKRALEILKGFNKEIVCPDCNGETRILVKGDKITCPVCKGTKKVRWRTGFMHDCDRCDAKGYITTVDHWEKCEKCNGRGKISIKGK